MKKIANFIVDHRMMFLIVISILMLGCGFLATQVKINNDQSKYLPEDSDTLVGLNIMSEEFGSSGTMSVMVEDISLIEASNLRKEIDKVDNVGTTIFLDTMLLSMKTDDSQADDDYIDSMFDLLSLVYKMQDDYFPDRGLSYVYDKIMEMANSIDINPGSYNPNPSFETDNGIITDVSIIEEFDDLNSSGQEISTIDSSSLELVEGYYKNKCALLSINFVNGDYDEETAKAIEEIIVIAPKYGNSYYTGQAASAYFNQKDMDSEMMVIALMAVIIIVAILLLATSSFVEPLLYAIVIIVAIVLNMGTNIIFGEISSIANTVQALLQLALSIDYSVFLLHTFASEKKKNPNKIEAMKSTLAKTIVTISSSSLTTIASFIAIMFMTFGIGLNFGLVMAKGIIFSLLTVFLLMPSITLGLDKAITKTTHRSIIAFIKDKQQEKNLKKNINIIEDPKKEPIMNRYVNGLFKHKPIFILLFISLIIPMYTLQANNNFFFGDAP